MLKNDQTSLKMKSFIYHTILSAVALVGLSGCNHDVFVEPLTIEPMSQTIEWTGGERVFKANQAIKSVWVTAFRWVNGQGMPIDDNSMQFSINENDQSVSIANELCDIKMSLAPNGEFIINSGYNLFADTIYLNLDIYVNHEAVERGARILPQPGFGHTSISYDLDMWQEYESSDTIMLAHIGMGDSDLDYTLRKKGDVVAKRAMQFKPWEKRLSDNIFGREPLEVDGVKLTDLGYWIEPELSGEKVRYTSSVQHSDADPLLYDEDVVVKLEANKWYKIRAIIKGFHIGVNYSIGAISPVEGLDDHTIEGVCWLSTPTAYTIEIESGELTTMQ